MYVKNVQIFPDHQPLTYAVSDKKPKAKLKRWKEIIDGPGKKVIYTPGKENFVAHSLFRC